VAGCIVSLTESKALGWAIHPYLADYPVLINVIHRAKVIRSVVADQPCASGYVEVHNGKWFSIGLTEFKFETAQLRTLEFRIGETDESIDLVVPRARTNMGAGSVTTIENIIGSNAKRHWVSGATYVEAEQSGMDDAWIVDLLYRDILGRAADPPGLANYVFQRRQGILTFKDIRKSLVESDEYKRSTKAASQTPGAIFSQKITMLAVSGGVDLDAARQLEAPTDAPISGALMDIAGPTVKISMDTFDHLQTVSQGEAEELSDVSTSLPSAAWPAYQERQIDTDSRSNESGLSLLEVDLPLDSVLFGSGWHNVEDTSDHPFRWMETTGVLFNPKPDLLCTGVVLKLSAVYGSHIPMLRVFMDDSEAGVSVSESADGFFVVISPANNQARFLATLKIDSMASGCPLQDDRGSDERVLSISVLEISWNYESPSKRSS
jgi:hypothetical protein